MIQFSKKIDEHFLVGAGGPTFESWCNFSTLFNNILCFLKSGRISITKDRVFINQLLENLYSILHGVLRFTPDSGFV